jgi:hypothetical protein
MSNKDKVNNLRDLFNIILDMRGGKLEAPFELSGSATELLRIKCDRCNSNFRLRYGEILYKKYWCLHENDEDLSKRCRELYPESMRPMGTIQQLINGICSYIINREIVLGDEPFSITKNGHTYAFVYEPAHMQLNEDMLDQKMHIFKFDKETIKQRMYNEFKKELHYLIVEKHQLNNQTVSQVDINSNISAFNYDLVRMIWEIPTEGLDPRFVNAASSSNTAPIPPITEHESSEDLLRREAAMIAANNLNSAPQVSAAKVLQQQSESNPGDYARSIRERLKKSAPPVAAYEEDNNDVDDLLRTINDDLDINNEDEDGNYNDEDGDYNDEDGNYNDEDENAVAGDNNLDEDNELSAESDLTDEDGEDSESDDNADNVDEE